MRGTLRVFSLLAALPLLFAQSFFTLKMKSRLRLAFDYADVRSLQGPRYCLSKGVAEQVAYDADGQVAYVIGDKGIQVIDYGDLTKPEVKVVYHPGLGAGTDVAFCQNGDKKYVVAVFQDPDRSNDVGQAHIFKAYDGVSLFMPMYVVNVGEGPDMATFTPDCSKILVANEGEGALVDDTWIDPEGSVTIIDMAMMDAVPMLGEMLDDDEIKTLFAQTALPNGPGSYGYGYGNSGGGYGSGSYGYAGLVQARLALSGAVERQNTMLSDQSPPATQTVGFDGLLAAGKLQGIRQVFRGTTETGDVSQLQDLEPEYIAISKDGSTAYVSLQENNAIAVLDIETAEFIDIKSLGTKQWGGWDASLDASNRDDAINMQPWPIYGLYLPDAMALTAINGKEYLIIANEGDAKDYGDVFNEEERGKDLTPSSSVPKDLADALGDSDKLGRLKFTTTLGESVDEPGTYDRFFSFGGRGWSIVDPETLEIVYDSGAMEEARHKLFLPEVFNSNGPSGDFCWEDVKDDVARELNKPGIPEQAAVAELLMLGEEAAEALLDDVVADLFNGPTDEKDSRSDDKGVETETVVVGKVGTATVLFVANERTSTISIYDISNPTEPEFQDLIYPHASFTRSFYDLYQSSGLGDIDTEGMTFVPAEDSPSGLPLLIVVGSVSGTITVYEVATVVKDEVTAPISPERLGTSTSGYSCFASTVLEGIVLVPKSKVLASFVLPPLDLGFPEFDAGTSKAKTDFYLQQIDPNGMPYGRDCIKRGKDAFCGDTPALFSGLTTEVVADGVLTMTAITDRGPNVDCDAFTENADGKDIPFPEDFAPTISQVQLSSEENKVVIGKKCSLKDSSGNPIPGVSNSGNDDASFTAACSKKLPFDVAGVDPEGIHRLGSESKYCLVVEEFSPSIMIVDCEFSADSCGTVMKRYVPSDVQITSNDAGYEVLATLPAVLSKRMKGKGFEVAAVSPDGSRAYVALQSPMADNSRVIRFLELEVDTATPSLSVKAMFLYQGESTPPASQLMISAGHWLGDSASTEILVVERFEGEVNFAAASDILSESFSDPLQVENSGLGNFVPVTKTAVYQASTDSSYSMDKLGNRVEGIAILNPCVVLLSTGSNWGLNNTAASQIVAVRLGQCLGDCPTSGAGGEAEALSQAFSAFATLITPSVMGNAISNVAATGGIGGAVDSSGTIIPQGGDVTIDLGSILKYLVSSFVTGPQQQELLNLLDSIFGGSGRRRALLQTPTLTMRVQCNNWGALDWRQYGSSEYGSWLVQGAQAINVVPEPNVPTSCNIEVPLLSVSLVLRFRTDTIPPDTRFMGISAKEGSFCRQGGTQAGPCTYNGAVVYSTLYKQQYPLDPKAKTNLASGYFAKTIKGTDGQQYLKDGVTPARFGMDSMSPLPDSSGLGDDAYDISNWAAPAYPDTVVLVKHDIQSPNYNQPAGSYGVVLSTRMVDNKLYHNVLEYTNSPDAAFEFQCIHPEFKYCNTATGMKCGGPADFYATV